MVPFDLDLNGDRCVLNVRALDPPATAHSRVLQGVKELYSHCEEVGAGASSHYDIAIGPPGPWIPLVAFTHAREAWDEAEVDGIGRKLSRGAQAVCTRIDDGGVVGLSLYNHGEMVERLDVPFGMSPGEIAIVGGENWNGCLSSPLRRGASVAHLVDRLNSEGVDFSLGGNPTWLSFRRRLGDSDADIERVIALVARDDRAELDAIWKACPRSVLRLLESADALAIAARLGHHDLARLLLGWGVFPQAPDFDGLTALGHARRRGDVEMEITLGASPARGA